MPSGTSPASPEGSLPSIRGFLSGGSLAIYCTWVETQHVGGVKLVSYIVCQFPKGICALDRSAVGGGRGPVRCPVVVGNICGYKPPNMTHRRAATCVRKWKSENRKSWTSNTVVHTASCFYASITATENLYGTPRLVRSKAKHR